MLVHVVCMACGEYGSIFGRRRSGDDPPACPRCGRAARGRAPATSRQRSSMRPIDENIVSWVSQPREWPDHRPDVDDTCPGCGLMGVMSCDSARGDTICPACMKIYWRERPRGYGTIACPGCGQIVEYSDIDRGKTIICPGCKYFLGCLVPPEKHAYRRRRDRAPLSGRMCRLGSDPSRSPAPGFIGSGQDHDPVG